MLKRALADGDDDAAQQQGKRHCGADDAPLPVETAAVAACGVQLTTRQSNAIAYILEQYNSGARGAVFLTGPAGTGKSEVVRAVVRALNKDGAVSPRVLVSATTGTAAWQIGGMSLHKTLGLRKESPSQDPVEVARATAKNALLLDRLQAAEGLIVEEASMCDAPMIDFCDQYLRAVRQCDAAFGGLQVTFCGDMMQLPPVQETQRFNDCYRSAYAFDSAAWASRRWGAAGDRDVQCFNFDKIHRQVADPVYAALLQRLRANTVTEQDRLLIESRQVPALPEDASGDATIVVPRRDTARDYNLRQLAKLAGNHHFFVYESTGADDSVRGLLEDNNDIAKTLELAVGAHVMFTVNKSDYLCNGRCGEVIDFVSRTYTYAGRSTDRLYPRVRFAADARRGSSVVEVVTPYTFQGDACSVSQLPLRYSWCISIHRSMGLTLPRVYFQSRGLFGPAQGYIALSRVCHLQDLFIEKPACVSSMLVMDQQAASFMARLTASCGDSGAPLCSFFTPESRIAVAAAAATNTAATSPSSSSSVPLPPLLMRLSTLRVSVRISFTGKTVTATACRRAGPPVDLKALISEH